MEEKIDEKIESKKTGCKKCTSQLIIGIIIGVVVATLACVIYFIAFADTTGDSLGFVRGVNKTAIVAPINEPTKVMEADEFIIAKFGNEPVEIPVEDGVNQCVVDCVTVGFYIDTDTGQPVQVSGRNARQVCRNYCESLDPTTFGPDEAGACRDRGSFDGCWDVCDDYFLQMEGDAGDNLWDTCHDYCYDRFCR
ncbi:hypothetical protein KKC88_03475 [Patescibacteria group bacterium]|nr:hypothetical protein [Patescibacteria group bacterium]MBU1673567.1 hypothetical protein [Patescibacteria group bacterium]MBU1963645.1 hypothetical protein [Patescibacteria group bacterium]